MNILISKLQRKYHKLKSHNLHLYHLVSLLGVGCVIFLFLYLTSFTQELVQSTSTAPSSSSMKFIASNRVSRILCYIPLKSDRFRVAKVIKKTWGSKCDKLLFFGNFNAEGSALIPNLTSNFAHINVPEEYELLWGKTKATLAYLHIHYGHEFEWFFKADTDTFVILENLRNFIDNIESDEKPLWFGFKMRHKKMKHGYMSGGAGYAMNAKALSTFANFLEQHQLSNYIQFGQENLVDGCKTASNEGIEDLELGRCFHSLGINDIPTMDELGMHRFLPLSLSKLMMADLSSSHWLWTQSWYPIKLGEQCCSQRLIAIHEVTLSQLKILHFLLYKLKIK